MNLRPEHKAVIVKFESMFPLPDTDEESRQWTHMLAEQMAYSFPTEGWGHKSAGGNRPHSADVIALKSPFVGFDIVNNAGSEAAELNLDAESIDLTTPFMQEYEKVDPVNYFDDEPEPPPTDLEERVEALEGRVLALEDAARMISQILDEF